MNKNKRKKEPIHRHKIKERFLKTPKPEINTGNWGSISLPFIRKVFPELIKEDFVSIQPMSESLDSSLVFEILDSNNPKIGQIFSDGVKHLEDEKLVGPICGCCV